MGRLGFVFAVVVTSVAAVACTVTSTDGTGSSGSSGSPGSSGGQGSSGNPPPGSSGNPGPGSSGGPSAKNPPPPSTVAAPVDINNACPAFVGCSAAPLGTYDYKSGCIGDVFGDARKQCPAMQTVNVKADVIGSITFDGLALARDVTADVSGTLVFPADCTLGQCATVENALKAGFDSATCTAQAGGCNCAVKRTTTTKDVATYTISGTTLTTNDGDSYDVCEKGTSLDYHGKSAGAEDGSWSLSKR